MNPPRSSSPPPTYSELIFVKYLRLFSVVCISLGVLLALPRMTLAILHTFGYNETHLTKRLIRVLNVILLTMFILSLTAPIILMSTFSQWGITVTVPLLLFIYSLYILHVNRRVELKEEEEESCITAEGYQVDHKGTLITEELLDHDDSKGMCPRLVTHYFRSVLDGLFIRPLLVLVLSLFACAFLLTSTLTTCHICISDHPREVSTAFTRLVFSNETDYCSSNTMCHMYFTIPKDMSTSMIVNFHSHCRSKPSRAFVEYYSDDNDNKTVEASFFLMDEIPDQQRYQFWADLVNLKPLTVYTVKASIILNSNSNSNSNTNNNNNIVLHETQKFKTGPSLHSDHPVTFVAGGDIQWTIAAVELAKVLAQKSPLFAVLGGDIFYEDGMPSCYHRVDRWFRYWNTLMVTPDGLSIPILSVIGNHEAGGWRMSRDNVGFFFRYFPHDIGLQGMDPNQRSSYHEFLFANHMSLTSLDSHVISPIAGQQSEWLQQVSSLLSSKRRRRFAVYHASAYPVDVNDVPDITQDIRSHFVPIFDQYHYTAVFENHYHVFAQSKRLRNGTVDLINGVYYCGQGSWGVVYPYDIPKADYLDEYKPVAHVYLTTCTSQGGCGIRAIGFDEENAQVNTLKHISIT